MPKNKPCKGLIKRVRFTKSGKVKFRRSTGRHLRSRKSGKLKRSYRRPTFATAGRNPLMHKLRRSLTIVVAAALAVLATSGMAFAVCGDSILEPLAGEACDDGNPKAPGTRPHSPIPAPQPPGHAAR